MRRITEVPLPGVGIRREFTSSRGERVAVVSHRTGHYELALYDRGDPDACRTVLDLDGDDAATLASVLGAPQVAVSEAAMHQIEGLALDWVTVGSQSTAAGATIADGGYRSATGSTIVAVIRNGQTHPAPAPDFALAPGDVAVVVGTPAGLVQLRALLTD
jgi:TrkA domain protein